MATSTDATLDILPVAAVSGGGWNRHDVRLAFVAALPPGARLLDAGCGRFRTLNQLRAARPDLICTGVDLLDTHRDCPAGVAFAQADLEGRLPFPSASFDAIFFCHVLEHLSNRLNVPAELARVLKPGGTFYIEGPSARSLWLPSLAFLPSRDPANAIGDDLNFFDNFTHVRPLTRRGLHMFLQVAGCRQVRTGYVRHLRKLLAAPWMLAGGLLLGRRRWVCLALWELCGWSVFAVGTKPALAGDAAC